MFSCVGVSKAPMGVHWSCGGGGGGGGGVKAMREQPSSAFYWMQRLTIKHVKTENTILTTSDARIVELKTPRKMK